MVGDSVGVTVVGETVDDAVGHDGVSDLVRVAVADVGSDPVRADEVSDVVSETVRIDLAGTAARVAGGDTVSDLVGKTVGTEVVGDGV